MHNLLPGVVNSWIGYLTAKQVPVIPNSDTTCVKQKTRLNLHGIISFEGAYVKEIEEKEEGAPMPAPMDVDGSSDATAPAPAPKKRIVKKKEIPIVATNSSLDKSIVEPYHELESQMHAADKLVTDTGE